MARFFLELMAGGTNCRAAIATGNGAIVGRGASGPANIWTDFDGARANIIAASRAALVDAGAETDLASIAAVLGLAGVDAGPNRGRLARLPALRPGRDRERRAGRARRRDRRRRRRRRDHRHWLDLPGARRRYAAAPRRRLGLSDRRPGPAARASGAICSSWRCWRTTACVRVRRCSTRRWRASTTMRQRSRSLPRHRARRTSRRWHQPCSTALTPAIRRPREIVRRRGELGRGVTRGSASRRSRAALPAGRALAPLFAPRLARRFQAKLTAPLSDAATGAARMAVRRFGNANEAAHG